MDNLKPPLPGGYRLVRRQAQRKLSCGTPGSARNSPGTFSHCCSCGNPLAGREMPCPCSAAGVTGPRVARIALHLRYCYSRPWGCSWRGCPGRASCSSGSLAGLITHDGALLLPHLSVDLPLSCACRQYGAPAPEPCRAGLFGSDAARLLRVQVPWSASGMRLPCARHRN